MPYREPLADETLVIVAAGKTVFGMDRETGARRWQYDADLGMGQAIHTVRVMGRIVLALGQCSVIALDYRTGALVWQATLDHPVSTLLVHGDRWFVGGNGEVTALGTDGTILWHDGLRGYGMIGPALAIGTGAVTTLGDAG